MRDIVRQLGGPGAANSAIGIARGENPGTPHPLLKGMTQDQLSQLDRYSQGANFGAGTPPALAPFKAIAPLVLGTANEGLKSMPPGVQNAMASVLGPQFKYDETASKPSLEHVKSLMSGYADAAAPGLLP